MVDHFNDLTYVNLTISTSQEKILEEKESFEIWASTFGVKTKNTMQTMEDFLNNLSGKKSRILTEQ